MLEFDHLGDKEFTVSYGIRNLKWEAVIEEMTKCDVVCANCHRCRTAQRGGFVRAVIAESQPERGAGDRT